MGYFIFANHLTLQQCKLKFETSIYIKRPRTFGPNKFFQYMSAQPPGVRVTHMIDPTLHTGIKLAKADAAAPPSIITLA